MYLFVKAWCAQKVLPGGLRECVLGDFRLAMSEYFEPSVRARSKHLKNLSFVTADCAHARRGAREANTRYNTPFYDMQTGSAKLATHKQGDIPASDDGCDTLFSTFSHYRHTANTVYFRTVLLHDRSEGDW
jgi:hypothetical protein